MQVTVEGVEQLETYFRGVSAAVLLCDVGAADFVRSVERCQFSKRGCPSDMRSDDSGNDRNDSKMGEETIV